MPQKFIILLSEMIPYNFLWTLYKKILRRSGRKCKSRTYSKQSHFYLTTIIMLWLLKYLTTWSFVLVLMDIFYSIQIVDTFLLSSIVSVFGMYITYIMKELRVNNIKLKGIALILFDILFHQLPFILMLMHNRLKQYSLSQTHLTILLICIYYNLVNIYTLYSFDRKKILYMIVATFFWIYILLLLRYKH